MINHNIFSKYSLFYIEIPNPSCKSYEKYNIIQLISYYTLLQRRKITSKFINNYFKYSHNLSFDDITYNEFTKEYTYLTSYGQPITFEMLSNYLTDKYSINELLSRKRNGRCHIKALELGQTINNSKLLTGYITLYDIKVFHSVVEIQKNNEPYIIDWTYNLFINKKDYLKLFQFDILSTIKGNNITNDLELFEYLELDLSIKTYLLFRDEIITDLNKNKQLIKRKD